MSFLHLVSLLVCCHMDAFGLSIKAVLDRNDVNYIGLHDIPKGEPMILDAPPVYVEEIKQEVHKQGQLILKLFNTRIEAADFTVQNNGFLGQYTDGRYFVVYEIK